MSARRAQAPPGRQRVQGQHGSKHQIVGRAAQHHRNGQHRIEGGAERGCNVGHGLQSASNQRRTCRGLAGNHNAAVLKLQRAHGASGGRWYQPWLPGRALEIAQAMGRMIVARHNRESGAERAWEIQRAVWQGRSWCVCGGGRWR